MREDIVAIRVNGNDIARWVSPFRYEPAEAVLRRARDSTRPAIVRA
jgi:hypothetical protein